MEVFVFNPRKNRETLREFNARIQEFCLDNPVVGITPASLGSNLIISLLLADDLDQGGLPTYMPAVRSMKTDDIDLEEQLAAFLRGEREKNAQNDPRIPSQLVIVERKDKPEDGWAVLMIVNGEANDEDEGGGGDSDGGDEGDDQPSPDGPAVAFPTKVHDAEIVGN